ncbi:hypothetical protein IWZ01DRAFT_485079 [Phyllosticta capitalensis]
MGQDMSTVFDFAEFPQCDFQIKRYTDLAIHCRGQTFHVHKVILSARSAFFSKICEPGWLRTNSLQQARVDTVSLSDYDPLVVKAVLTYCYTADFNDDTHLTVAGEDWTEIERRLHFCVALYAAACKLEIQGLGDAILERFRCITISAFTVIDYQTSIHGHEHLTSAGVGRITRLVFETDRRTDGPFRTLVFCKLHKNMTVLSQQSNLIKEVDKIRKNFWKHLARFNLSIASKKRPCPNTSCPHLSAPGANQLVEWNGTLKCDKCGESFALDRWFKSVDTSGPDSEEDDSSDEENTVLLTPSTIC